GQEAANAKRLRFFEKDTIDWSNVALGGFYKTLNELKKNNKALWNGTAGGDIIGIGRDQNKNVFACERKKDDNRILAIINLSAKKQKFTIDSDMFVGDFTDVFRDEKVTIDVGHQFDLEPWQYIVLKNLD
ncbi:MAG TPA: alpha-amylase, partial [Bacteroidetes bacterium]|nr:alpha-amylase [Bacteroidota bacterium]